MPSASTAPSPVRRCESSPTSWHERSPGSPTTFAPRSSWRSTTSQPWPRPAVGSDAEIALRQGHVVHVREHPVRRAAIYVPGGRAPYPSTVVMGVVTARVAGVEEIVVCAPGAHPAILAACALCGVEEVYRVGGAHAIAALAYGTETIERVDVIAGPGNLYVQEAKRHVSGDVGIDGFLGPSDLLVLASGDADPELIALDLRAQAEHGDGTLVVAVSDDVELCAALEQRLAGLSPLVVDVSEGRGVKGVESGDGGERSPPSCVSPTSNRDSRSQRTSPPSISSLIGEAAERLAARIRSAGCVFVGSSSATAFGDYVAGSNHSLPTGGSARYASALSPRAFRRRMTEVRIGDAAAALAPAGAAIARAEGFEVHAASMEARVWEDASQ